MCLVLYLDLYEGENGQLKRVVVIGATNRGKIFFHNYSLYLTFSPADSLDPSLRRSGRFEREIGLGNCTINTF